MKPKIKFGKYHSIDSLLNQIKVNSNIESNNGISFTGFTYDPIEWILLSIIDFGGISSIILKKKILINAIKKLILDQDFSEDRLLKELDLESLKYKSSPYETYVLLTSFSAINIPIRKIKLGDCTIYIHGKNYPKHYRKHRQIILEQHILEEDIDEYSKISIEIKSSNSLDALQKAYNYSEVFRAFLCLLLNSKLEINLGKRSNKPINKVRQGIVATLHHSNGETLREKFYSYVQDFTKVEPYEVDKKPQFTKSIKWMINKFNCCSPKLQNTISKALYNYVSAFDESNKFTSFLKAWTVLEILTDTDKNDILIERSTAFHKKEAKSLNRQILESLRLYRNESVHEGENELDPSVACFYLQSFIFNLIVNHIFINTHLFENISQSNLYLDSYSPDIKELLTRKKMIDSILIRRNTN